MSRLERFILALSVVGFASFVLDAIFRVSVALVAIAGAIWTVNAMLWFYIVRIKKRTIRILQRDRDLLLQRQKAGLS